MSRSSSTGIVSPSVMPTPPPAHSVAASSAATNIGGSAPSPSGAGDVCDMAILVVTTITGGIARPAVSRAANRQSNLRNKGRK
jgi:hypothetical protein